MPEITEEHIETVTDALLYALVLQVEKVSCELETLNKRLKDYPLQVRSAY